MRDAGTTTLQACLNRVRRGDAAAPSDLLAASQGRLRLLARRMLRGYPRVGRWESADDILQDAQVRLHRALAAVPVADVLDYLRLAAWHIRHVLIDAVRRHYGPYGVGANHATPDPAGGGGPVATDPPAADDPGGLAGWAEFHAQVERMPGDLRTVFDALWYHGLGLGETAGMLGVSVSTVQRRWTAARLWLRESFRGELPV